MTGCDSVVVAMAAHVKHWSKRAEPPGRSHQGGAESGFPTCCIGVSNVSNLRSRCKPDERAGSALNVWSSKFVFCPRV